MQVSNRLIVLPAAAGEKTVCLSHFYIYIYMLILPRQARDKHRGNSKRDRFLAVREVSRHWLRQPKAERLFGGGGHFVLR